MSPAREWTAFIGGSFALMGASLVVAAARRAQDAVAWENERRRLAGQEPLPCEDSSFGRLQLKINRVSGAAVLLAGAAALGCAAAGRVWGRTPTGAAGLGLGAVLILAGLFGAVARAMSRGARPDVPKSERSAEVCSWSLRALWIAYGLRLLTTLRF